MFVSLVRNVSGFKSGYVGAWPLASAGSQRTSLHKQHLPVFTSLSPRSPIRAEELNPYWRPVVSRYSSEPRTGHYHINMVESSLRFHSHKRLAEAETFRGRNHHLLQADGDICFYEFSATSLP